MEQMFFCLVLRVIGFCPCKPLILIVIETFAESEGLNIPSAAAGVLANKRPLLCNGRLIVSRQPYDRKRSTAFVRDWISLRRRGRPGKQRPLLRNGRLIVSRQPYDRKRSTAGRSGLDIPFAAAGVLANKRPLLRKAT